MFLEFSKKTMSLIFILGFAFLLISCEEILLGDEPENNPKDNFEILWNTFDKNYALFTVKNLNWDSLYGVYSSKITSSTTDEELWNIMGELLSNLNDGHVKLYNENYSKAYSSSLISKRKMDDFSLPLVKNSMLSDIKTTGLGIITYAKIKNYNIGYIHIASFSSNSGADASWAYDIDKAISYLSNCESIIIDLRNNGGGLRVTVDIIAGAFINKEITYFFQQTRTGPAHTDLSNPFPAKIFPRNSGFTKKNVLLTNRFSASGSEYFTQIFKHLDYSKQIGDTTFGAFGDIISISQLPNGWTFTYPCRLTKTPEGKCFEGIGITPDILIENTASDILSGNDKVIKYAVEYLSK